MHMAKIDIGIFAHNEERAIGEMLSRFSRQSLFATPEHSVRVFVLANGCSDRTAEVAKAAFDKLYAPGQIDVVNLAEGGKSRTWNKFVHELSRPDTDFLLFCDADLRLPS